MSVSMMPRKKAGWSGIILGGQHIVFRVVSVAFSAVSAWAIYWVFVTLGVPVVAVVTAVAFVALGYYVTRVLAYRLLAKKSVWSMLWVMLIYAFVEVSCNFAHAAASYPDVTWMAGLHGPLHTFFSYDLLVVLSIIPLFNIALAQVDVGLMQEKGQIAAVAPAVPKMAPAMSGLGRAPAPAPQASYSGSPVQGSGVNALKAWWGNRSAQAQQQQSAQAGLSAMPVMPAQTAASGNGMLGIP